MKTKTKLFTDEQLDFVKEMMNIGAGNAAASLQQMLQCPVDLKIPRVHVLPAPDVPSVLEKPASVVACVRMGMVGDIKGSIFFIVPEEHRKALSDMAQRALMGSRQKQEEVELSAVAEIGNILSGVYLTAIHDFCGMNIFHTVPVLAIDMIQSLLDEALAKTSLQFQIAILVENEFVLQERHIRTILLVIPAADSVEPLINALGRAKKVYGPA
jgi:chemotaxis protein CheC